MPYLVLVIMKEKQDKKLSDRAIVVVFSTTLKTKKKSLGLLRFTSTLNSNHIIGCISCILKSGHLFNFNNFIFYLLFRNRRWVGGDFINIKFILVEWIAFKQNQLSGGQSSLSNGICHSKVQLRHRSFDDRYWPGPEWNLSLKWDLNFYFWFIFKPLYHIQKSDLFFLYIVLNRKNNFYYTKFSPINGPFKLKKCLAW